MSWSTREHSRTHLDVFQTQHATSKDVNVHTGQEGGALFHVSCLVLFANTGITRKNVKAKTMSFEGGRVTLFWYLPSAVLPQKALPS